MRMLVGRPKDGERRLLRTHLSGGLSRGEAWNRGRLSWKEAGLELSFGDPASVRESRTEEEMGPHIHSESMTPTGTGQGRLEAFNRWERGAERTASGCEAGTGMPVGGETTLVWTEERVMGAGGCLA